MVKLCLFLTEDTDVEVNIPQDDKEECDIVKNFLKCARLS